MGATSNLRVSSERILRFSSILHRNILRGVLQLEFGLYIVIKKLLINNFHSIVLDGVI